MTDHKPCDPADPCATAYDLASERNTLDGLWAETKDRLDAALAQVARLREALQAFVDDADGAALVRGRDIEKARAALAETADTPAAPPADDGWIKWEGGECPVGTKDLVQVQFRIGDENRTRIAYRLDWEHEGTAADIVAYRIVEARDG